VIIPFYIYILLRFLVVYIKRRIEDVSGDNNDELMEDLNDMISTKSKIKDLKDKGVIDRIDRGLPVSHKDFQDVENIKKEYDSYFDEDSGNTLGEGLSQVDEYLQEEIDGLKDSSSSVASSQPLEDESKKRRVDDSSSGENKAASSSTDLPTEMSSIYDDMD